MNWGFWKDFLFAVGGFAGGALTLWGHFREVSKVRRDALEREQQRFAAAEVKAYAAERDFGHIKRQLGEMSQNFVIISRDLEGRMDHIEKDMADLRTTLATIEGLLKGCGFKEV